VAGIDWYYNFCRIPQTLRVNEHFDATQETSIIYELEKIDSESTLLRGIPSGLQNPSGGSFPPFSGM
jgi:hypothetical protein